MMSESSVPSITQPAELYILSGPACALMALRNVMSYIRSHWRDDILSPETVKLPLIAGLVDCDAASSLQKAEKAIVYAPNFKHLVLSKEMLLHFWSADTFRWLQLNLDCLPPTLPANWAEDLI